MNHSGRILILTGLGLIAMTMFYGVGYAVFDEHQTLVSMLERMAGGFAEAAKGNMASSSEQLDAYGALNQEYRNEVHSHGHWGMLALVLIVLGLVFQRVGFADKTRHALAWLLALSAVLFPLGVLLQNYAAAGLGQVFALAGSAGMILGLLAAAWGLARTKVPSG